MTIMVEIVGLAPALMACAIAGPAVLLVLAVMVWINRED